MPRPHVDFSIEIALIDSDQQAIVNGILLPCPIAWSIPAGLRPCPSA